VLEEAIRVPYSFTPDLVEENALMSDLTGGRAANGGARGGPVPVTQPDRSQIRTPQMIMNARRQRQEAEEQRKAEEERRRSAERRAQAAGVAGTTTSGPGVQRQPQSAASGSSEQYVQYPPPGVPRQPEQRVPSSGQPQDTTAGASHTRTRTNSSTQQPPRPTQANQSATAEARRPPPAQHARRPSAGPSQAGSSTAVPPPGSSSGQPRDSTTSSFPHAFERWETLSSHWEGLTSYWIRRLEANTDEVRREPLAQQLSRQITDLSAAGANLFHAVVELQRLRASSERKFQRWFYDHRQEQERAQEREAQLVKSLETEREARKEAEANMERMATEKKNAERAVGEMKRELQISKEEARRAWEELGRREQEERDRTFSLREGQPTWIGGVQVVPREQGMGRGARAPEDAYAGAQSGGSGIEQHYSYEEGQSPTDTDPFTESARHGGRDPDAPSLAQGTYVPAGASSAASSRPSTYSTSGEQSHIPAPIQPRQQAARPQQAPAQPSPSMSQPEAFYQQPASYLHQDSAGSIPEDERSYVTSQGETSEGEEDDYATDEQGRYLIDEQGHRIPYSSIRSPVSDEYDVQEDRRRELEHLQRYGTGASSAGGYATSSTAGPSHPSGFATAGQADYSGDGYGDEWVGMRHHHPTRLSDVPEEDERSRTSPSRASQASRGRLY
jgi:hypothetical protein